MPVNLPAYAHEEGALQVVVSTGGQVLGCRPVNGFGAHFYARLSLRDYKTPWAEMDRSIKPGVAFEGLIEPQRAEGSRDPERRGWGGRSVGGGRISFCSQRYNRAVF